LNPTTSIIARIASALLSDIIKGLLMITNYIIF
jgi:hypothetical protein